MKKSLLIFLTFLGINVFAQTSFSHSAGAGYLVAENLGLGSLFYNPRLNLIEVSENSTISVGSHLGLGFSFNSSSNSRSGSDESSGGFGFDIPVVAEYNFGCKSNPDNEDGFGFFLGTGGGYNSISVSQNGASASVASFGVYSNLGLRFILKDTYPVELRGSYLLNVKDGGVNVIGATINYCF
jgi:hypothetical protein